MEMWLMWVHHINTDLYAVSSRISAAVMCARGCLQAGFNTSKTIVWYALLHFNPLCVALGGVPIGFSGMKRLPPRNYKVDIAWSRRMYVFPQQQAIEP